MRDSETSNLIVRNAVTKKADYRQKRRRTAKSTRADWAAITTDSIAEKK
jgi:hypothetical protein